MARKQTCAFCEKENPPEAVLCVACENELEGPRPTVQAPTPAPRPGEPRTPMIYGLVILGIITVGVLVGVFVSSPKEPKKRMRKARPTTYQWKNGIGVHLIQDEVIFVEDGSPAEEIDIQPGDVVMVGTAVGTDYVPKGPLETYARQRKPGAPVKLLIQRGSYARLVELRLR